MGDTISNLLVFMIQAIPEPSLDLSIPNYEVKNPAWSLLEAPQLLSEPLP